MAKINERGQEVLSSKPLALPTGMKKPKSVSEMIQQYVRTEISQAADRGGAETFEEAEDFYVADEFSDPEPSNYELEFDPTLGREIPAQEKRMLDAHRAQFDQYIASKKKQAILNRDKKKQLPENQANKLPAASQNDDKGSVKPPPDSGGE